MVFIRVFLEKRSGHWSSFRYYLEGNIQKFIRSWWRLRLNICTFDPDHPPLAQFLFIITSSETAVVDTTRYGRPVVPTTNEMMAKVKAMLNEDRHNVAKHSRRSWHLHWHSEAARDTQAGCLVGFSPLIRRAKSSLSLLQSLPALQERTWLLNRIVTGDEAGWYSFDPLLKSRSEWYRWLTMTSQSYPESHCPRSCFRGFYWTTAYQEAR